MIVMQNFPKSHSSKAALDCSSMSHGLEIVLQGQYTHRCPAKNGLLKLQKKRTSLEDARKQQDVLLSWRLEKSGKLEALLLPELVIFRPKVPNLFSGLRHMSLWRRKLLSNNTRDCH